MASSDSEWNKLVQIIVEWLIDHPNLTKDEEVASWLDASLKLQKSYNRYKNSYPGMHAPAGNQVRYLLGLWKANAARDANFRTFLSIVEKKHETAEVVEKIRDTFGLSISHGDHQQSDSAETRTTPMSSSNTTAQPPTSFNAYGNVTIQIGAGQITTTNTAPGYIQGFQ